MFFMRAVATDLSMKNKSLELDMTDKKPSLVWVSSIMPDRTLDAATWLDTTAHLRALGWQVALIGVGPRSLTSVRGIDVICLPRPNLYLVGRLIYHFYVICFLLRVWRNVDIVLFDQISLIWLLPVRWLRAILWQKRPLFVMDTRDLADLLPASWRVRVRLWFFHNVVFGLARRWADGQTAITKRMADLVAIPTAQRLGFWPSGVDVANFAPARRERTWPAANGPVELIYIGSFVEKRNLLPLSRAVVRANAQGMNLRLSLYGDGKMRALLTEFADTSNGAVVVMAPVSHTVVPTLLAQAHVGVTSLPSQDDLKYQASSPVKLFEYLAAGMPILSTRNVCHTDVVGKGHYAFWADSPTEADLLLALQQLWQQRQHLATLGDEAASVANHWSWAAAAQKLSDALFLGIEYNLPKKHKVAIGR